MKTLWQRTPLGRNLRARRSSARTLAVRALGACVVLALAGMAERQSQNQYQSQDAAPTTGALPRIVSLNPSLTAIILRIGAGESLVGVDEVSADLMSEVEGLPRVGGLLNPSLEAIVALRPDRILIVAGVDQETHGQALERLGLTVETFENARLAQVLENIERLGRQLGRVDEAAARIKSILATRSAVARALADRPRPATLAIVDRSPLYLVGGDTFLDEMLEVVGAENLARTLGKGYPRGSIEWLIGARPELLLDMTPGGVDSRAFWGRWPSLPAVQNGRVLTLDASRISLPGPDLDRALVELAVAVHGPEIEAAIAAERAKLDDREGAP